eukprot:5376-Alexandrium_andersonii.AAC.2
MEVQIADVKKPLASVRRICQAGNRVVFDEQGSYIEHKHTGMRTRIDQDDQGYAVALWLPRDEEQDFPRQGSR